MNKKNDAAKRISFSAIALALTVICLYGASALSTGRLAALGISSVFGMICVHRFGVRYALALYVGASLLSLLLVPNKMFVFLYVLFAGYYPIVKLYIEKLYKLWAEWLLKILFFNVILAIIYILFRLFFMPALEGAMVTLILKYIGIIIPALELIFVLFDWMLSYIITYYDTMIRRMKHV